MPPKLLGTCRVALPFASSPLCAATSIDKPPDRTSGVVSAPAASYTVNNVSILSTFQKKYFPQSDTVFGLYSTDRQRVYAPCAGHNGLNLTMPSRKRSLREAESAPSVPEQRKEDSLLHKLRNSFYFANLYQWICIFGKVVKVDDNLDIAVRSRRKHGFRQRTNLGLIVHCGRISRLNASSMAP